MNNENKEPLRNFSVFTDLVKLDAKYSQSTILPSSLLAYKAIGHAVALMDGEGNPSMYKYIKEELEIIQQELSNDLFASFKGN